MRMSRFKFLYKPLFAALLAGVFVLGLKAPASVATNSVETVGQGSTGEMVVRVQLRLRELGYLNFKPTGNFLGMSVGATIAFQQSQSNLGGFVSADGTVGPQTQNILFSARAVRAAIPANVSMPIGPSLKGTPTVKGELVSWDEVKTMLTENQSYTVTDYNTGHTFNMTYLGGEGHAEVECTTSDDTYVFRTVFGGTYNYSKRPVVIKINGKSVAASLFGYPHGEDAVSGNDMDGITCLYFDDSVSHVGHVSDIEHQKQVFTAAGA